MSVSQKLLICVGLLIFSGSVAAASPAGQKSDQERIRYLQKQVEQKQKKIDQLKTQNVFLQELSKSSEGSLSEAKEIETNIGPTLKEEKVLTGVDKFGPGEKVAYAKVIESYRKEKIQQTIAAKNLLLHHYPKSIYADNSIYLVGILQLQSGDLGKAIQSFNQIIEDYPRGNKRASALFAKSIAYKRLNLPRQAQKYFKQVLRDYPGSKESQRAWMEIRMMKDKKQG